MNYLCKSQLTQQDLQKVMAENQELRRIIEAYLAGSGNTEEFIRAKQRVNDLLFLVKKIIIREKRKSLTLV